MQRTCNAIREALERLDGVQMSLSHLRVTEESLVREYECFTSVMLKCGALLEEIVSRMLVAGLLHNDLQQDYLVSHLEAMQNLLNEALERKPEPNIEKNVHSAIDAPTLQPETYCEDERQGDSARKPSVTWQATMSEFVELDEKKRKLEREADAAVNCMHEIAVCSSRMAIQTMYEH